MGLKLHENRIIVSFRKKEFSVPGKTCSKVDVFIFHQNTIFLIPGFCWMLNLVAIDWRVKIATLFTKGEITGFPVKLEIF